MDEYRYDGTHGRELEMKRSRGEVSCAECRRLKIKCDKQIPCQSCLRRGCASLCPNGSLATGQGTRFVLAATEHLHRRIAKLSSRIRQLEDALAGLQAKHSADPHPLLHDDLVSTDELREGLRDEGGDSMDDSSPAPIGQTGEVIDALGTLSISDHGISRFFGPTGGSESLLLASISNNHPSPSSSTTNDSHSPSASSTTTTTVTAASDDLNLSLFSQSFPFTPVGAPRSIQDLIEVNHLPPYSAAISLCNTYFTQVSWLHRGVTQSQLLEEMLPMIYHLPSPSPASGEEQARSGPHDLALLFIVLAIGSLLSSPASSSPNTATANANALGEHYHQISRAALALQPVLEKPSIVTIQALHLLSIYNAMSGSDLNSETSMEMTWSLVTLAAHLSQTIGLHRDSARWGLSPKMVQRRRILFWDLFVADVWQSLNTGRPPSFSMAYIDCSFPSYDEKPSWDGHDGDGSQKKEKEPGSGGGFGRAFEVWAFRFAAECVADVAARTLTAEAPTYSTIMELDRKVRDFPVPDGMRDDDEGADMAGSFQRCLLAHIKETILMYIHRSFFAQAIIEHPENPLKSTYAPSFLAAYRAATTILKNVRDQFAVFPNSCARFWQMWTFAFSAAVVFGTVVTRGPRSPLSQSAMAELDQACVLFSKAAAYSIRAQKALHILQKLSEKARHALALAQREPSPLGGDLWSIDDDDELAIFAGRTRFVRGKSGGNNTGLVKGRDQGQDTTRFETDAPLYRPPAFEPEQHVMPPPFSAPSHYSPLTYPATQSLDIPRGGLKQQQFIPPPYTAVTTHQEPTLNYGWPKEPHHLPPPPPHIHGPEQSYHRLQQPQRHLSGNPQLLNSQEYHGVPHSQPQNQYSHHLEQVQAHYTTYPTLHSHRQVALSDPSLADLGLAARDSRLDERWGAFMSESGILDGFHGSNH